MISYGDLPVKTSFSLLVNDEIIVKVQAPTPKKAIYVLFINDAIFNLLVDETNHYAE